MAETTIDRPRTDPLAAEDLRGAKLVGADLSGRDLSGRDLTGADLSRAKLAGARLIGACLRDAVLFEADLGGCELLGVDLRGADLSGCDARKAGFGNARLDGAKLFGAKMEGASLTGASLRDADLRTAGLEGCRLREASCVSADFSNAVLRRADLQKSDVCDARFLETDLRGARLRGMSGYDRADWIGADIFDVDFTGAYLIRRVIADQNYLHEFRTESRANAAVYWIWWATSDCGRSFLRWGLWTAFLAVVFAAVYETVAIDPGDYPTALTSLYYSVITLTTLGYGDVLPASPAAQALAMLQVVMGYVMLGGLLSIFSNKMARRAD